MTARVAVALWVTVNTREAFRGSCFEASGSQQIGKTEAPAELEPLLESISENEGFQTPPNLCICCLVVAGTMLDEVACLGHDIGNLRSKVRAALHPFALSRRPVHRPFLRRCSAVHLGGNPSDPKPHRLALRGTEAKWP